MFRAFFRIIATKTFHASDTYARTFPDFDKNNNDMTLTNIDVYNHTIANVIYMRFDIILRDIKLSNGQSNASSIPLIDNELYGLFRQHLHHGKEVLLIQQRTLFGL